MGYARNTAVRFKAKVCRAIVQLSPILPPSPRTMNVRKVAPKGQVAALGVREGWKLTDIGGGGKTTGTRRYCHERSCVDHQVSRVGRTGGGTRNIVNNCLPDGDGISDPALRHTRCTAPPATTADTFSVTATSTSKNVLEALAAAQKKGKPYTLGFSATATAEETRETGRGEQGKGGTTCREDGGSGGDVAGTGAEQRSENEARNRNPDNGEGKELEEHESSPIVGNDGTGDHVGEDGGEERARALPQEGEPVVGRGDGEVTLMYEMYDEKFPIKVNMFSSACTSVTLAHQARSAVPYSADTAQTLVRV